MIEMTRFITLQIVLSLQRLIKTTYTMPERPVFPELVDLDMAVESEIAKYLGKHLYSDSVFESAKRVFDASSQQAGKDIIISSSKLGLDNVIVDEKSSSHHVNNKKLHTFAFELSYYKQGKDGQYTILTEGWLSSPQKVTDYYMLVWPSAQEEKIIKYRFDGEDYPYFTMDDITKLDYALVSRRAIREYLTRQGFDDRWLGITMTTIRKQAVAERKRYFKKRFLKLMFSCSNRLNERPVNVLIEKSELFKMAILHGTC